MKKNNGLDKNQLDFFGEENQSFNEKFSSTRAYIEQIEEKNVTKVAKIVSIKSVGLNEIYDRILNRTMK